MEQNIMARAIIDILGGPKEHIEKALKDHVDKIKKEGLDVQAEVYEEAKPKDNMFTAFVELTIQFKDLNELLDFCFDSMPSSIEIFQPAQIILDLNMLTDFLNDFQAKLHHTDMMLKGLQAQKQLLDKNALHMLHNFAKFACSEKSRTAKELSKILGIGVDELQPFLNSIVERGGLKKEGDTYTAA